MDVRKDAKVVAHHRNSTAPALLVGFGSRENFGLAHETNELEEHLKGSVGKKTDNDTPRDGNDAKHERDTPLTTSGGGDRKSSTTNEDNDNWAATSTQDIRMNAKKRSK